MSGHSKWANIKHRKAAQDAKKAGIFTKLAKEVVLAARFGADPLTNFRLKIAIDRAKSFNMPKENIDKAIKKGSGQDKDGKIIEEVVYEAFGQGQISMLIKTATDNKNRTFSEIRNILNKNGGKIASEGSVKWQFDLVGFLEVNISENILSLEEIEEIILETNAIDYKIEEEKIEIFTDQAKLQEIKELLEEKKLKVSGANLIYIPKNRIEISDEELAEYEKLYDFLENYEEVVEIYDNL